MGSKDTYSCLKKGTEKGMDFGLFIIPTMEREIQVSKWTEKLAGSF